MPQHAVGGVVEREAVVVLDEGLDARQVGVLPELALFQQKALGVQLGRRRLLREQARVERERAAVALHELVQVEKRLHERPREVFAGEGAVERRQGRHLVVPELVDEVVVPERRGRVS